MKLSRTELQMLGKIAEGNEKITEIAKALKKSKSQVYKSGQKLVNDGFVICSEGLYEPVKTTHVNLSLRLVGKYPSAIQPLSGAGIKILTALLKPKSILEIVQETGIKRTQVFKKLKQAKAISLVRSEQSKYFLNQKIWKEAADFLSELKKYEETTDMRVSADSVIYFKNEKEIVFSNKSEQDAALTGFSAYGHYGIKLFTATNYYYLPKRELGKEEVFRHSLLIAEKESAIREYIFVALFYAKYKKELAKTKHKILDNINKIFQGERISGYPSLQDIKDRADIYGIKV